MAATGGRADRPPSPPRRPRATSPGSARRTCPATVRPNGPTSTAPCRPPHEDDVHHQWETFVADGLDRYDERRNLPAVAGTSRLSIALRWGLVHPAQLLDDLGASRAHDVFPVGAGLARVLRRRPVSAVPTPHGRTCSARWTTWRSTQTHAPATVFEAWQQGRTGYPIVDAGNAPAAGHGVDAQPGADDHGQLPGEGPAPAVAVGCPPLHAAPARRRPGLEPTRLAVDRRHGHRRRALLPRLQPGEPVGAVSTPRATTCASGCPSSPTCRRRASTIPVPPGRRGTPAPVVTHATEREEALRRYKSLRASTR